MELSRRRFLVVGGGLVVAGGVAGPAAAAEPAGSEPAGSVRARPPRGRWYAGDTHVHDDHSSDGSLPRQTSGQRLPGNLPVRDQIGRAEQVGLDFLPLTDHRTYDQHWDPQWTSDRLLLIPGEEANGSPHAVVLGAVDSIVDGANPAGSAAFRHVQQSIWDAHAQAAVWSVAHPDDGELAADGTPNANASAVGVDSVEVWNIAGDPDAEIGYAEDRWNRGFRFGAVAACDNHFRELWDIAGPGTPTTWVFAAELTERAILDGIAAGHTTVSRSRLGPFVTIEADLDGDGVFEAIGGDEVVLPPHRRPARARLRVRVCGGSGATLYVFAAPGRAAGPLARFALTADEQEFILPVPPGAGAGWYRAEVRSPGDISGRDADPTLPDQLRGATSPIFVSVGAPAEPRPEIPLPDAVTRPDGALPILPAAGRRGAAAGAPAGAGFAGFADVAVDGSTAHVVAEAHRDGRVSVRYRRLPTGHHGEAAGQHGEAAGQHGEPAGQHGEPAGEPVELSAAGGVARAPRVAAAGRNVWVVWQESPAGPPHRPDIYLRHSRDGGHRFGPPTRLSAGTGRAIHPALTVLRGRFPVVAWTDNSGGPFDVRVQVVGVDPAPVNVSAPGKVTSTGTPDDARSPRYPASLFPSVAVDPAGGVLVAWQDDRLDPDPLWTGHTPPAGQAPSGNTDPDNWQIMVSRRAPDRPQWTPAAPVRLDPAAADRHPSVAVDRAGRYVLAWETQVLANSGVNLSLRASWSADGGATWSAAEPLGVDPAAMSQRPRLGHDAAGAVHAVWYDSRSTDWRWQVFGSRFDPVAGWAAPRQLTGVGNATWPALAAGAVVFTSDRHRTRPQRDRTPQVYLTRLGG